VDRREAAQLAGQQGGVGWGSASRRGRRRRINGARRVEGLKPASLERGVGGRAGSGI
jgi:hypothetical protein